MMCVFSFFLIETKTWWVKTQSEIVVPEKTVNRLINASHDNTGLSETTGEPTFASSEQGTSVFVYKENVKPVKKEDVYSPVTPISGSAAVS